MYMVRNISLNQLEPNLVSDRDFLWIISYELAKVQHQAGLCAYSYKSNLLVEPLYFEVSVLLEEFLWKTGISIGRLSPSSRCPIPCAGPQAMGSLTPPNQ